MIDLTIIKLVVLIAICFIWSSFLGRFIIKQFSFIKNENLYLIYPVIGFSCFSFSTLLFCYILQIFNSKNIIYLSVLISTVFLTIFLLKNLKITKNVTYAIVLSTLFSIMVGLIFSYSVMIHPIDIIENNISQLGKVAINFFDHAKISIITSIKNHGIPVVNPFGISPSGNTYLSYYFGWYFTGYALSCIFDLTPFDANVLNVGFTSVLAYLTILFITITICKPKGKVEFSFISILVVVLLFLPSFPYPNFFTSTFHSLETLLYQLVWVPQHVYAASVCCITIYFIKIYLEDRGFVDVKFAILLSFMISSMVSSSIYVSFVFVLYVLLDFLSKIFKKAITKKYIANLIVIAFVSLIVCLPFLCIYTQAAGSGSGFPLKLKIWKAMQDKSNLVNFFSYFTIDAFIYFGVIYLSFLIYLFNQNKDKIFASIALISFVIPCFLSSTIANNDLGWRVVLPFCFVSSAFFIFVIIRSNKFISAFLLTLFGFQLSYSFGFINSVFINRPVEFSFNRDLIDSVRVINSKIPNSSRILANTSNINGYSLLLPTVLEPKFSYLNYGYFISLQKSAGLSDSKKKEIADGIDQIFLKGIIPINILKELQVQYIIVYNSDPVFNNGFNSKYTKLYFEDKNLKIYKVNYD